MFVRSFPAFLLAVAIFAFAGAHEAAARMAVRVESAPVPAEMKSSEFTIRVNGKNVDVAHAAANYSYASFTMTGPVTVEITAADAAFWEKGVDVEPWRLGIRPQREGATIRFRLDAPAKLSISRPRDFLSRAHMLFLFATPPERPLPRKSEIQAYLPGVYHQSLNPKSGDTIYLAPGSYFYGSLNLWNVENVTILGHGTIVYEGPQDPNTDEGWMQKPDWHCVGAVEAHNVRIEGLTCLVRSRTWSIQMKDSTGFVYDDLRVIGGNTANANQDGMDWLGGGDALVRNSFFRASDDVIAMLGNWDGYGDADLVRPGHDVANITVEDSVLSTSVSNVVRAAWPRKVYNMRNFTLRNSDVLHAGIGACGQSFGLFGYWGAKGFKGDHDGFTFENIFLDNWYSLVQIERDRPSLTGVKFKNIWALGQPSLAASTISGPVGEVAFENVKLGQKAAAEAADLPLHTLNGAAPASFTSDSDGPVAAFTYDPPVFKPGEPVTFTAQVSPRARYTWLFGDGTRAVGRVVTHRFVDADGTELNGAATGAGRFRVLLRVEDKQGREDWAAQNLVAVARWRPASGYADLRPGLSYSIYPGVWTELPNLVRERPVVEGVSRGLQADAQGFTRYATAWDGYLDIPADGGYTFHLLDRDGARLVIDGVEAARTGPPFAQVCGSTGNAIRYDVGSIGLLAGPHAFHLEALQSVSRSGPRILWEGPALPLADIPEAAYRRVQRTEMRRTDKGK